MIITKHCSHILCVLIFIACLALYNAKGAIAEITPRHVADVGAAVSHITYEEPGFMEEKGIMYGVNGSYAYHNKAMLKIDGLFSSGQVDYSSTDTGSADSIADYIIETRGLLGYDLSMKTTSLTPYIGIGYRYLSDNFTGTTSTGHRGYERESNYFYSPIGVELTTSLNAGWSIGSTIEYDRFWRGWQVSHLSDVSLGYNDLENTQRNGYGVRASAKLVKEGKKVDIIIEPFIRYWDIDNSDKTAITYAGVIVGVGYEPHNKSTEYGINIKLGF